MPERTVFTNIEGIPDNGSSNYSHENEEHVYTVIKHFKSDTKVDQPTKGQRKKRSLIIGLVLLILLVLIIVIVIIVLATASNIFSF